MKHPIKHPIQGALCASLLIIASGAANATLVERLSGLAYYDTAANLTWLADANYAQTSGYDADGRMNWADANAWAASLDIAGVTGWRLPDSDTSCGAFNCTGSEMGNLFYNVLGGTAGTSITTSHNTNYALFSNVQSNLYWSATEYPPNPFLPASAWLFGMDDGIQGVSNKANISYAWAVQSGDVSAVPAPAAVWLFGSGLLGLLGVARRRSANIQ